MLPELPHGLFLFFIWSKNEGITGRAVDTSDGTCDLTPISFYIDIW